MSAELTAFDDDDVLDALCEAYEQGLDGPIEQLLFVCAMAIEHWLDFADFLIEMQLREQEDAEDAGE